MFQSNVQQQAEQLDTNETVHTGQSGDYMNPVEQAYAATNNNSDMERQILLTNDEAFAKILQKEEEEEFERRHRFLQRHGTDDREPQMSEYVREAYPMQETGPPAEDDHHSFA